MRTWTELSLSAAIVTHASEIFVVAFGAKLAAADSNGEVNILRINECCQISSCTIQSCQVAS